MGSKVDEIAAQVRRMADDVAAPLGLEVVEVVFRRQGKHSLLRIDVDRSGTTGAGLADCEQVSRGLEILLDREDPIGDAYDLQVSSPGIDRPIASDDDFRRNTGRPVVLDTRETDGSSTRVRGILRGVADGTVRLIGSDEEEVRIPRDRIALAKQDVEADLHAPRRHGARRKRGSGVV